MRVGGASWAAAFAAAAAMVGIALVVAALTLPKSRSDTRAPERTPIIR
jgi:predicted MFS family arabinose efflux permease